MATTSAREERLEAARGAQVKLVRRLAGLGTPALGPDFATLGGEDLADALVVHRLSKHFQGDGSQTNPKVRKDSTIAAMLHYDSTKAITRFDYRTLPQPYRGQVLMARASLATFFKGFKQSRRFRAPTGETVVGTGGLVDLMFKLSDPQQWNVSFEAASDAAAICYNNTSLKRLVKERFRETVPLWNVHVRRLYKRARELGVSPGWYVFKQMFLSCCTIKNYSRLSTVAKNATTDRPISMEPLWNMIAQLSFARDLRDQLMLVYGIDLTQRANLHRTLIRHARKATVDFSNASNSNWLAVLEFLLPPKIFRKLCDLRTPVCEYKGRFHHYNMLAPMGCGFTFEVMTIVLLHLGRVLDKGCTVFGDDVIIEADQASTFIGLTQHLGWVVNTSKTFLEGNFRESCGGFHDLSTKTDILSYEMHEIKDEIGICVTANKLYRLITRGTISLDLKQLLYSCYRSLIRVLPDDVYRSPDEVLEDLPDGVALVDPRLIVSNTSKVSALASSYLHTKMRNARVFGYQPIHLEAVDSPRVLLASFLHRGSSYTPEQRTVDKKVIKTVVYADCNGSLASVPLLSFI